VPSTPRSARRSVVVLSSPETAALSKLLENIFRSVNIALVNCPGMGGHCLPVDPFYLAFKASERIERLLRRRAIEAANPVRL
jgi:UDP-N-acetyl-D-mannosaminuronate dehydrogenase